MSIQTPSEGAPARRAAPEPPLPPAAGHVRRRGRRGLALALAFAASRSRSARMLTPAGAARSTSCSSPTPATSSACRSARTSRRRCARAAGRRLGARVGGEGALPGVLLGSLHGEAVLLVTTGIGHDRAALCLADVLRFLGPKHVRDAVFLGTAGFSPAVGGVLASAACAAGRGRARARAAAARDRDRRRVRRADRDDWDCHRCEWATPATVSQCDAAPCHLHHRWDLFGSFGCTYNTAPDLADELLGAARAGSPLPAAPARLRALAGRYWRRCATARASRTRRARAGRLRVRRVRRGDEQHVLGGRAVRWLSRKYVATAVSRGTRGTAAASTTARTATSSRRRWRASAGWG